MEMDQGGKLRRSEGLRAGVNKCPGLRKAGAPERLESEQELADVLC